MLIQGAKLTGQDTVYNFGSGVALSADGVYALVSGSGSWIFSRRFGSWSEEAKLSHSGGMALASNARTAFISTFSNQIYLVRHSGGTWAETATLQCSGATILNSAPAMAISHDRSTLLVGDETQNNLQGKVWVFVRDEQGKWSEQNRLIGFGAIGAAQFGNSVALSNDGHIALVGGVNDNKGRGAVWTFTRDDRWHPLNKLVLPPDTRDQWFGLGVALSANGDRALISDRDGVRTFLRTLTGWQQDGDKLPLSHGGSVALSADGTTALIGDNLASGGGAAWLWLLAGAIYKLTATDAMGAAFFGSTVALAPDGNTALIGGYNDNGGRGAAWLFINPLAITRLTPPSGPASGGTTVMISGTGFSGATHVRFGPTPATSFTVDGATQITAISPPGQPGVVDVTVTTSVGTSEAIPASKFTYV